MPCEEEKNPFTLLPSVEINGDEVDKITGAKEIPFFFHP